MLSVLSRTSTSTWGDGLSRIVCKGTAARASMTRRVCNWLISMRAAGRAPRLSFEDAYGNLAGVSSGSDARPISRLPDPRALGPPLFESDGSIERFEAAGHRQSGRAFDV